MIYQLRIHHTKLIADDISDSSRRGNRLPYHWYGPGWNELLEEAREWLIQRSESPRMYELIVGFHNVMILRFKSHTNLVLFKLTFL